MNRRNGWRHIRQNRKWSQQRKTETLWNGHKVIRFWRSWQPPGFHQAVWKTKNTFWFAWQHGIDFRCKVRGVGCGLQGDGWWITLSLSSTLMSLTAAITCESLSCTSIDCSDAGSNSRLAYHTTIGSRSTKKKKRTERTAAIACKSLSCTSIDCPPERETESERETGRERKR